MILLNFTYPLTVQQQRQIQELLSLDNLQVREVHHIFLYDESFVSQARDAFDRMELSGDDIEHGEFLVMPPGHPAAAVAIVLEVGRRTGHVPLCVRLKRATPKYVKPARFDVAEIMSFEGGV